MLAPYSHRNQPTAQRRLSRLIESGAKQELIEMLRSFDPRVMDLEIVTEESTGSPTITVLQTDSCFLPLSVMGDGFRRALTIALAITQARNGILLIDEIETALHVSVLNKLFAWLYAACESYDVQLFATTHSLEAVTAIMAAVTSEKPHDGLAAYHLAGFTENPKPPLGAHQKLTTSARIELTMSKTHVATWHGTASVSSSPAPQAHKSFSRYGGGVLIRSAQPRATRPHSAQISRNPA